MDWIEPAWVGLTSLAISGLLWRPEPRVAGASAEPAGRGDADAPEPALPILHYEEDDETGHSTVTEPAGTVPAVPLAFDDGALGEEPTDVAAFAIAGAARTDCGRVRAKNEDSYLVRGDAGLFVVADGMGGHRGGAVASELAVRTIGGAFELGRFDGTGPAALSERAGRVARAIHMANRAIRRLARARANLKDMGTTVVAALFAPEKQRVYIGHIGDSRCYRLRDGRLEQLTSDHTMAALGVKGEGGARLARAVGTRKSALPDVVVARPRVDDVYLLCSDGLTKMLSDEVVARVLADERDEHRAASVLVDLANARGGIDNVTALVVRVHPPDAPIGKARTDVSGQVDGLSLTPLLGR